MSRNQENFNIVFLGDSGVGKSSIINRIISKKFEQDIAKTIGASYAPKCLFLKGINVSLKLDLWDTPGREEYFSLLKIFVKNADGCIIVYDITNYKSFENINKYYNIIKETGNEKIQIILIGNKIDLYEKQEVSEELGEKKAKELNVHFFHLFPKTNYIFSQLSCKSDHNSIDFDYLLEELAFTIYIAKKGIENIKFYEKDDYENDNEKEDYKNYEKEKKSLLLL